MDGGWIMADPTPSSAETRALLHRNRAALDNLLAELGRSSAALPRLGRSHWRGPAAWAFRSAVDALRSEMRHGGVCLRDAESLAELAVRQGDG